MRGKEGVATVSLTRRRLSPGISGMRREDVDIVAQRESIAETRGETTSRDEISRLSNAIRVECEIGVD